MTPVAVMMSRTTGPTLLGIQARRHRTQRGDGLRNTGVLVEGPASLDTAPELVELGVDDHDFVVDPHVGGAQELGTFGQGDPPGQLGAERRDRRRIGQQRQLASCLVHVLRLTQEAHGAFVRLDESVAQRVDPDGQHGGQRTR